MRILSGLLTALAMAGAAHAAPAPDPALYFSDPAIYGAGLSPSGRHVALLLLGPHGRSMLASVDSATRKSHTIAGSDGLDIHHSQWLSDERLLIGVFTASPREDGMVTGLYAVDRAGSKLTSLVPTIVGTPRFTGCTCFNANSGVVGDGGPLSLFGTDDVLVNMVWDGSASTLARLNTRTGNHTLLPGPFNDQNRMHARDRTLTQLLDGKGAMRITLEQRGATQSMHLRDNDGRWSELARFNEDDPELITPKLYLNGKLYVQARNGRDTRDIYRYDVDRKMLAGEPLISAPGFDPDGDFIFGHGKLLGYRTQGNQDVTIWFDERMKAVQKRIDASLPDTANSVLAPPQGDAPYLLVSAASATHPRAYYLYDQDSGRMTQLGRSHPGLDPAQMAPQSRHVVPGPEGVGIPVYLTSHQRPGQAARPIIVLMNDSPSARWAVDEFSPVAQYLAALGFAVIQPEPRGTHGYGLRYYQAGHGQWTRTMQADLAAVMQWAAGFGGIDARRACIAGSGHGGFAAVLAFAQSPGLFKCALSWSPVADPDIKDTREWVKLAGANAPRLLEKEFAAKGPVMLAFGEKEPQAPSSYLSSLASKLKAAHPQSEVAVYSGQESQAVATRNRIDFWRRAGTFMLRHTAEQ